MKILPVGRIVAGGMLREGTPVQHYPEYGLFVKREDLSCTPPGPPFSKARGVYRRVASRPETLIGVLDTYHSQAGWAVARACQVLGKKCWNFYPEFKYDPGWRRPQTEAAKLGADLKSLKAGRSSILFHQARKTVEAAGGYMMPNALKLWESVEETAAETPLRVYDCVLVPVSSGTIAAGVIKGFCAGDSSEWPEFVLHMGYSRSREELEKYVREQAGARGRDAEVTLVDEGYAYKDEAKPGETPPWPCNRYYDLKLFRWWMRNRRGPRFVGKRVLFWNVG